MNQSWIAWPLLGCVVVGLAALATTVEPRPDAEPSTPSEQQERTTAIAQAKRCVAALLKSPSTAVFPADEAEYVAYDVGKDWTVRGYVDAQNSFGAMLRSTWKCELRIKDNKVTLLNVVID
jgi:hypothetical protein